MLGLSGSMANAVKPSAHNQRYRNFDGSDQSIDISELLEPVSSAIRAANSEFSVSCWFRQATTSATGTIFRAHESTNNFFAIIYKANADEFQFVTKFGGVNDTCNSGDENDDGNSWEDDGIWHHLVATVSATDDTSELWIDGTKKETISGVGTLDAAITSVAIGQSSVGSSFHKGDIDEVAFWGRQLTDAEIAIIYNATALEGEKAIDLSSSVHVSNSELIGYFRFEETSGEVAINSAPTKLNGEYTNGPAVGTTPLP